jgi:predicted DCC family thiol-disulfide oxidoreductase YuxK
MDIIDLPKNKKIILFDGICNLCSSSVQFIIKHDRKDVFRFVSIQSELGQKIIKHIDIQNQNIDSIILYEPGIAYYYKSSAVLQIAKGLKGFFMILIVFNIIPTYLGNIIYDFITRNRYNWFGKKESCMLPTDELKGKFLA